MKKRFFLFVLYFLALLYLVSCGKAKALDELSVEATIVVTRPVSIPIATVTIQPTNSLPPTTTPSPQPTFTPFPTITPSPTPIVIQELCRTVYTDTQQFPPNLLIGIVYDNPTQYPKELLLQGDNQLNPTFHWQPLDDAFFTVATSPNGKWLVITKFGDFSGDRIKGVIINPNTQQSYEIELPDNWIVLANGKYPFFHWLNDEQLFIQTQPEEDDNQINYLVWSPFANNQYKVFSVKLPGYENRHIPDYVEAYPYN